MSETTFTMYPIPGCTAYVELPNVAGSTAVVDGDLTLADLRWLVAEMERIEGIQPLRQPETLILGPGGINDPRAMVYADGSIATTKDGITWTLTTKSRAEVEAEAKEQAP